MSSPASASAPAAPPVRLTSAHLRRVIGEPPGPLTGFLANLVMGRVARLSWAARERLARFLGGLAYRLGIRRRVALDNLAQAMPERSEAERHAIARGAYITMARVVLEALADTHRLPPGWEQEEVVGREAWEALQAHVATGKGALLVTAHFGNWELLGEILIRRGVPLNALVRPLKGALNTRIAENRVRAGAGLIYPKGAVQETVDALGRGESVYMLLDQGIPSKGVFVPFFGRLASTTPAMAVASQRTGIPAWVVMGVREGARMRVHIEGPIPPPPPEEGKDTITEHTARVTAALERVIRQYPEQWLWLHRRWKYAPPAPESPASSGTLAR
ncbi:lysophospholipid acyltransferase family protein [Hyalangium rubrum]|uniref:Lipid A biosynthesis acyltransferase n=1 Tax=Hyalangium rubrum TaxID=3103134 RepID=A0ABU5HBD3_9BACT|nr:lipid A biosynthesis acyltransferase [Hyalangium sp. s54d21]MDY7230189.1 lipid A biosynthesis acyltransferase [Hyalangium sp. s54d21]